MPLQRETRNNTIGGGEVREMRSVWTIERMETLLHHDGTEIAFLLDGGGGTAKAIAMNKGLLLSNWNHAQL